MDNKLTKQEVLDFLAIKERVWKIATSVADEIREIEGIPCEATWEQGESELPDDPEDIIWLNYYTPSGCGCCPGNTYHIELPVEALWEEGWANKHIAEVTERREREMMEQLRKRVEDEKRAKTERDLHEKAEYERLKKKFEGGE